MAVFRNMDCRDSYSYKTYRYKIVEYVVTRKVCGHENMLL